MHLGLAVFRSAFMAVLLAAGMLLAVAGTASATANPPGQIFLSPSSPDTVQAATTGNTLVFDYEPERNLTNGTLTLKIPKGWTVPQNSTPGSPGNVTVSDGTASISKRVINVDALTLCGPCEMNITYADATAQPSAGTAVFLAKAAKAHKPLEPLVPAPSVDVSAPACNPQQEGVVGPPGLELDPGTCITGGELLTLSGSGFTPSGLALDQQCNNDPNQPTVDLEPPVDEVVPVSCSGITASHLFSTSDTGTFSTTWTAIVGTTGPPCGTGDLAATCPLDSSGGNAATDAAAFPCPPTPAQQAAGYVCDLHVGDYTGKQQSIDMLFEPLGE